MLEPPSSKSKHRWTSKPHRSIIITWPTQTIYRPNLANKLTWSMRPGFCTSVLHYNESLKKYLSYSSPYPTLLWRKGHCWGLSWLCTHIQCHICETVKVKVQCCVVLVEYVYGKWQWIKELPLMCSRPPPPHPSTRTRTLWALRRGTMSQRVWHFSWSRARNSQECIDSTTVVVLAPEVQPGPHWVI